MDVDLHCQNYRQQLRQWLESGFPGCHVYDPLADHGGSLDYDDDLGRGVFLQHNRICAEVDVVIAYLPQASMGTAIEMWEAWQNGRLVIAISPMSHNWVVRFCSHLVYENLHEFQTGLESGEVQQRVAAVRT